MKMLNLPKKLKSLHTEYLIASKILGTVLALIQIPTILRICGVEIWLQIATIQSIAVILSPIIQMHWAKFGGVTLLQNTENNQNRIVLQSISSRLISLALMNFMALSLVLSIFKNEDVFLLLAVFFYASSLSLTNEWFYLAKSNFRSFFARETLPRFLFTSFPLIFIETKTQLVYFFLVLALVNLITCTVIIGKIQSDDATPLVDHYTVMEKVKFTILQFLLFLVLFSPVPLVNFAGFDQKFQFTILERFFRLFMTAVTPITQIAHSQILSSRNLLGISRYWYRKNKLLCIGICGLYLPSLIFYLTFTETTSFLWFNKMLILLFGLLVVVTFAERIIEEIFVLNSLDIRLINKIQIFNLFYLSFSFTISAYNRNSMLLVVALILSELCRFFYMRHRLIRLGIIA